ncbi:MAG: FHA domain-containing protein [Cyanobacteria bacterium]|nr:FHA domain-containing protein [Cyanobacteriota bacterium]MDA0867264.1 FHA domain-containing protein [Cyanobacteriota bacterium]
MQVQLRWTDPNTGKPSNPTLATPIAFGSDFAVMPSRLDDQAVSRMVLPNNAVEPYHALLEVGDGQLLINDRGSRIGAKVNGVALPFQPVVAGDILQIGPYEITVVAIKTAATAAIPNEPAMGTVGLSEAATAASASGGDGFGPDGTCDRQIGFLVKRRCGRTSTAGCPHCRNGQVATDTDPYRDDYDLYPGYGHYGRNYWGYHYYSNRDRYYYDPASRQVDFTEADAASFEDESDQDYEMDLDAS